MHSCFELGNLPIVYIWNINTGWDTKECANPILVVFTHKEVEAQRGEILATVPASWGRIRIRL